MQFPIDSFFKVLAYEKKDKANAVVLSGTGSDGTLGVGDIKTENGIVFVQTPENAKYNGMPVSAISSGVVDFILDADKMAEKLISCIQFLFCASGEVPNLDEFNYTSKIFDLLRSKTGHDFSYYKSNTILRRVERRMKIAQVGKIEDYIALLLENTLEVETLYNDFLIGVTSFFRDPDAFDSLYSKIIPEIFSKNKGDSPIRIWIPGGSTGEEAYTVAILMKEFMDKHSLNDFGVPIFATDINENAINIARQAV